MCLPVDKPAVSFVDRSKDAVSKQLLVLPGLNGVTLPAAWPSIVTVTVAPLPQMMGAWGDCAVTTNPQCTWVPFVMTPCMSKNLLPSMVVAIFAAAGGMETGVGVPVGAAVAIGAGVGLSEGEGLGELTAVVVDVFAKEVEVLATGLGVGDAF